VCGVVAAGIGGAGGGSVGDVGGGECVAALEGAVTFRVTLLVVQVDEVQLGVPSFVKTATFVITSPVVSVAPTTAWKLTDRELAAPGWTMIGAQVTVPVFSVALHVGALPQVAEPLTYVVPTGTLSVRVIGVVAAVPESVRVSV
jgi:hypothetical protein